MVVAEIVFWGSDRGGRLNPPRSGFRPQLLMGSISTSCTVTSLDKTIEIFEFNHPYLVTLELMFPNDYGDISTLDSVDLFEGSKQIAKGVIK
jgi:hypothetical protein